MADTCTYSIGHRLSRQLALQTALGLSVLCIAIYGAAHWLLSTKHSEQMDTQLSYMQEVIRQSALKGGEQMIVSKMEHYAPRRPGTYTELLRADNTPLYRDAPSDFKHTNTDKVRFFEMPAPNVQGGMIKGQFKLDCSADARLLTGLGITLILATLGGAAAVGWGTFWRVRRSLRPLKELAKQTRHISAQHLDQRLHLKEPPAEELAPWLNQFNALMERLERSYAQLDAFNADVAHELRTPLANLIGQTEVTLSRERSPQLLRDTLISNLEELQRLSAMVNDMLFLASADRGASARRDTPVSLAALASQVVEFHEAALEDAQLTVKIEGDAMAAVDAPLFKRAVSNLVGNATRYAKPGSLVRIQITSESPEELKVTVENAGQTIDAQQLPRLFDRFFRADTSRYCDNEQQHHGLGLAIVAAIARMHAGRTLAESQAGLTRIGFTLAAR
jgi:two-component system, OmpR family, heavy metal sensor histidine kinase CusS